jgi:DNA-binding transcriptional LysR family regulator
VPSFALRGAIATGDLAALLDDYKSESAPVGAAYLEGRTLPRKVRTLIDFAFDDIKASNPMLAV